MHVDLNSIDELTNALSRNVSHGLNCVEGFSFGAAMELAVWVEDQKYTSSFVGEWSKRSRPLSEALRLLRGGKSWEPQNVHERAWDGMRPIRSCQCISQQHHGWNRFLERFAAALKAAGFVSGWNQAMAGVLHEMADNVVQHSTLGSGKGLNGIVGYSVGTRRMAFTVADSGVGAVQSLKDNPLYSNIVNGREALELIARQKASRRSGQAQGNGFKDLFIKLAAMNGRVRLRSADGLFSMTGRLDGCAPVMKCLHPIEGFHVSVECEI